MDRSSPKPASFPPGAPARPEDLRHILITGASGGLGTALALAFADATARLSLWGRNETRLHDAARPCLDLGATVHCALHDVRRLEETRAALAALDSAYPVDMAILNAGVSSGALPGGELEPVEDVCRVFHVNATASLNAASCLYARMAARRSGHLVFISSLAALFPLPSSPAYSAAKSALTVYARALRLARPQSGVRISIVYPGYVETPMSRRLKGPQPMRWSAGKAARHIRSRLEAGSDTLVFPKLLALGTYALNFLPAPLAGLFARHFAFTVEPDAESPAAAAHPTSTPPDTATGTGPEGVASVAASTGSPGNTLLPDNPEKKHG